MNESFKYRSDRSQTGADRDTPLNLTGQRLIARGNRNGNYNNSNVDETKIGRNYPQAQRHTHTHTHTYTHTHTHTHTQTSRDDGGRLQDAEIRDNFDNEWSPGESRWAGCKRNRWPERRTWWGWPPIRHPVTRKSNWSHDALDAKKRRRWRCSSCSSAQLLPLLLFLLLRLLLPLHLLHHLLVVPIPIEMGKTEIIVIIIMIM